jgi:hypothetical protein
MSPDGLAKKSTAGKGYEIVKTVWNFRHQQHEVGLQQEIDFAVYNNV